MMIDKIEELGLEYLNECFDVNFETGEVKWKERPLHHFKNLHSQRKNNSRLFNKKINYINKVGYYVIRINNKLYSLHRIIWFLYYGSIDKNLDIDHINGNKLDNRIINLRLVSHEINSRNQKTPINNTSGFKGVSFHKLTKKWRARIKIRNRKLKHIGLFINIEDAIEARKKAELEYGYLNTH